MRENTEKPRAVAVAIGEQLGDGLRLVAGAIGLRFLSPLHDEALLDNAFGEIGRHDA